MPTLAVSLTDEGYLHLPAETALRFFPHDLAAAVTKPREMWLMPTRGAAAGGLILKQRNPQGDRSVLVWHLLPPGTAPGPRPAFWDEARGALRVAL